mmetsp:Transcript_37649/g.69457  ORF Transcript_37649/g.69457 Transcript_37649/m.69457 type:complete len:342 (+) Transcript_37649:164-1189(+)
MAMRCVSESGSGSAQGHKFQFFAQYGARCPLFSLKNLFITRLGDVYYFIAVKWRPIANMTKVKDDYLVDVLHLITLLGFLGLKGRNIIIVGLGGLLGFLFLVVVSNAETELDELVDAAGEDGRLRQAEPRSKERGLEEEPDKVLNGLVLLVLLEPVAELLDDRVLRVELKSLLGDHKAGHGVVAKSLGLHDTLHVGRPSEFAGDKAARRVSKTVGKDNLLDLVTEDLLHLLAEVLEGSLLLLALLLLVLGHLELEVILCDTDKLLLIVLLELLHGVLIDGVNHEKNFVALLLELLKEGRLLNHLTAFTGDVVNVLLLLLHASNVVLERGELVGLDGRVVSE